MSEVRAAVEAEAWLVMGLTETIKPLLVGHDPGVQSGVLANLTALWLAGHISKTGSAAETAAVREDLLGGFIGLVRALVEPSEQEILDGMVDRSEPQ